MTPDSLFNAARFLLNRITDTNSALTEVPFRISTVHILYTLAKQVRVTAVVDNASGLPLARCCLASFVLFCSPRSPAYFAAFLQGFALGAFKLARFAYEKMNSVRLPPSWRDPVDLSILAVQGKPYSDNEVGAALGSRFL